MKDKENDNDISIKESIVDNNTGDSSLSDRVSNPHWLLDELNEILQKGMFKDG